MISFLAMLSLPIKDSKGKVNYYLLGIAFCILVFYRTFVEPNSTPDLPIYQSEFNYLSRIDLANMARYIFDQKQEFGYLFFSMISSHIYNDFSFLLLLIGLLITSCTFSSIKKYSPFIWISIIIYVLGFYRSSWFQIRQYIAIAICMATYPLIIKKKLVYYIITLILAFSIHKSCIVFFPIYFIYNIKSNKTLVLSLILLSLFIGSLLAYIPSIIDLLNMAYVRYLDNENKMSNLTPFYISLAYYVTFVIILKKKVFEFGINRLVFVLSNISLILTGLCIGVPLLFRLVVYFSISTILLIPLTMRYIKNVLVRYLYAAFAIVINIYMAFYGTKAKRLYEDPYLADIDNVVLCLFVILSILTYYFVILFPNNKTRRLKNKKKHL